MTFIQQNTRQFTVTLGKQQDEPVAGGQVDFKIIIKSRGNLDGKVSLLAVVTKDMCGKCHAGKIIKEVAKIVGGSGGGRPDMAQAGGAMPDKLPEALEAAYGIIEKQMS